MLERLRRFGIRAWLMVFTMLFLSHCGKKEKSLFSLLPADKTQIAFQNSLPEETADGMNIVQYLYYYNGGGVAAGDVNHDGLVDLYFSSNLGDNALYLNKGNFVFEDATEKAGLKSPGAWKTGVSMVDINGDGWLDIYLCRVGTYKKFKGHNELYINNQDGTFSEKSTEYGLDLVAFSTQAAFFDFDRDNDLDCFLLCHSVHSPASYKEAEFSRNFDPLSSDRFLRNDNGHFTDITAASGLRDGASGYGLGLSVGDVNNDGFQDVYVANDFHENDFLYLNQAGKSFKNVASQAFGHSSNFSMGCDLADLNNDGWLDILSLDMKPEEETILKASAPPDPYQVYVFKHDYGYNWQFPRNNLQLNQGIIAPSPFSAGETITPSFSEIGQLAGVATTDWSWSPLLADLDLDGWKDLYISNGIPHRPNDNDFNQFSSSEAVQRQASDRELVQKMPSGLARNYGFRNDGHLKFENVSQAWGLDLLSCSNGAVYADLDNDGDWDLVANNLNAPAAIYRNESKGKNWLKIKLNAPGIPNDLAYGAKIILEYGDHQQTQEIQPVRAFQSSVEATALFGLDSFSQIQRLRVLWPDGTAGQLSKLSLNQCLTLRPGDLQPISDKTPAEKMPSSLFSQAELLPYADSSKAEDIANLKLLPWSLQDRACHWTPLDLNDDGFMDLLNAKACLLQTPNGAFKAGQIPGFLRPFLSANTSCIRPCDFDGDGDQDYFIGKRFESEAYGISVRSILLENQGNNNFVEQAREALGGIGDCSDAQWLDLNGDHKAELLVAGNWAPLLVLSVQRKEWSLSAIEGSYGLWNCLSAPEDADGDGDLDLIVGNWGLNSNLQGSAQEPLGLWVKDFDGNGSFDPVISYYRQGQKQVFQDKNLLVSQMPSFKKRYLGYKKFAESNFDMVFEKKMMDRVQHRQASMLQTCFLENTGEGQFRLHPLPLEAQFSIVQAACFQDFNADGKADILIGGNQGSIQPSIGRMDASFGAVFLNEGRGVFSYWPNREAGLKLDGDLSDLFYLPLGAGKKKALVVQREKQLWLLR